LETKSLPNHHAKKTYIVDYMKSKFILPCLQALHHGLLNSRNVMFISPYLKQLSCVALLLASFTCSLAQKSIVISDSLAVQADKFPVKTGNAWPWNVYNFSFGDYAIASSKAGWRSGTSKTNLLGTKSQSKSSQKFSFVLTNKTTDTVEVNAVYNCTLQELRQTELFPSFYIGNDELLEQRANFTAFISLNGDTSTTRVLYIIAISGSSVANKYDAFLTNRERTIFLSNTSADKNTGKERVLSALGYEFVENGQSLGAVQYFGGGMLGINKKVIWMHKALDAKMKLILAAAMTAIMQFKS